MQIRYNEIINEFKRQIPANQLLHFNPRDGWQPLCDFLDAPIPQKKLPLKVTSGEIRSTAWSVARTAMQDHLFFIILYFGTLILIGLYLWLFY